MTALLFYNQPELLNREVHKELKFSTSSDYSFTKNLNSVPLTGIEFFEASRDMPVMFSKDEEGNYFPLALLSLLEHGHKQMDSSGAWDNSYIPAFVRRYPFALTEEGSVCFDTKSEQFGADKGEVLFTEDGKNSEALDNIIQFLNNYDQQFKSTKSYCEKCRELELFAPFNLKVMVEKDKPLNLNDLYILDEKKLSQLKDKVVTKWFKVGWLAWSYAHLHSISSLKRLIKRQAD